MTLEPKDVITAEEIIRELEDREGFDHWWGDLPGEIHDELIVVIAEIVSAHR